MNYQRFTTSQHLFLLVLRIDTSKKIFNCIRLVRTPLHCHFQGPILLYYQLFNFSRAVLIQNDEGVDSPPEGILPQVLLLHLEQLHHNLPHP